MFSPSFQDSFFVSQKTSPSALRSGVVPVLLGLIKITCAVNWIIVRERRAESTSLSHPDLAGSRGKTVSGHLELSPGAVDDHDFFCALPCSPCSTSCC